MAGLSSITAITRPLGEVDLAAMNRCVGVYKVYLKGGGGGGGGYDDFQMWYGGAGSNALTNLYTGSMAPPIALRVGAGGSVGVGVDGEGRRGGTTSIGDLRNNIVTLADGGIGGSSAYSRKSYSFDYPANILVTAGLRFTVGIGSSVPSTPYISVTTGKGGSSMNNGNAGGIIKAFRIG